MSPQDRFYRRDDDKARPTEATSPDFSSALALGSSETKSVLISGAWNSWSHVRRLANATGFEPTLIERAPGLRTGGAAYQRKCSFLWEELILLPSPLPSLS